MAGLLVLVATPIGNLGDISERAIETLRNADVIACEDTRHTRKLLNHVEIHGVPVIAVHEHNEAGAAEGIVRRITEGQIVAMVTDAGMPAISDPGERVVAAVADAGLNVSVIPGPSALPAALAISGLSTERFCFEGFLPRKAGERQKRLSAIVAGDRTTIFYESPQRLLATAIELIELCGGERRIVLVRELTKIHEEVWRGTLAAFAERLEGQTVKGECVLVLAGAAPTEEATDEEVREALKDALATGLSKRDAAASVAEQLSVNKNRAYAAATTL